MKTRMLLEYILVNVLIIFLRMPIDKMFLLLSKSISHVDLNTHIVN